MIHIHNVMNSCTYLFVSFFFFNDTATTEIYTLSLHDALPISAHQLLEAGILESLHDLLEVALDQHAHRLGPRQAAGHHVEDLLPVRSEEHTSELQSRQYLVCRLLLEKKKKKIVSKVQQ